MASIFRDARLSVKSELQPKSNGPMPTYESTHIRVKPFLVGAPRDGYVIIRLLDDSSYLSLTLREWKVLERLADLDLSLDAYVKWHLAGREGLSFHESLQLLLRLQRAGFFEEVFSEGVMQRLEEIESQGQNALLVAAQKTVNRFSRWMDFPLVSRKNLRVSDSTSSLVRAAVSTEGVLGLAAILIVLAVRSHFAWARALGVMDEPLQHPALCLLSLCLSFSFVGVLLGYLDAILLKGDLRSIVPWSLKFTSLFFFRIETKDEHTLLIHRQAATQYFLLSLGLPWLGAFATWWLASYNQLPSLYTVSFAFACFGVVKVCPFYRSSLIRWAESFTGSQQFLSGAREYLRKRIFAGLLEKRSKAAAPKTAVTAIFQTTPKSVERITHAMAAASLAWLYVCGLAFFDLFGRAFPVLAHQLFSSPLSLDFWASLLLLAVNLSVIGLMACAFGWILAGNVAFVAQVPLRRARRGLGSFLNKKRDFTGGLKDFLRESPVFADLPESVMDQLSTSFLHTSFRRGEKIVAQGESGNEFYLLADGEAQVVVERPDGTQPVVALLHPGDSFGEVALIEEGLRTATVRAASKCRVLHLGRKDFDLLFPQNSPLRQTLSQTLRHVKLLQESQGLSHLSARQIREFLAISKLTHFKPGEKVVTEGENAEHAFVLTSGTVKVTHQGDDKVIARLGAGDLLGMIGIIKASRRNADVTAETEVSALKVERNDFLLLCMTNIFVAILIANLSENQASQNDRMKKKPA